MPSIASVSHMSIVSKSISSIEAYEIKVTSGIKGKVAVNATLHLEGTKVEVKNLFFATSARLKFSRSDKTEYAACYDVVKKLAISYPYNIFIL